MQVGVPSPVNDEEKRQALDMVLASRTFARAEQLRAMLQYLCRMEAQGRQYELSEYLIGREVLRRPEDYSPLEDSSVRTRAYELRHKLEKFYQFEAPHAPIRIVLPKGTYVPQYERNVAEDPKASAPTGEPERHEETVATASYAQRKPWASMAIAGATVILLGVLAVRLMRPTGLVDPIIREAWGPVAQPDANVLLCVATPLHLTVGPDTHEAFGSPIYPAPKEAYSIWRQHRPLAPDAKLGLVFTDNVIGFGTMNAVLAAANTLRTLGTSYQIFPERVAPVSTFRNRNVMLFGAPVDSEAVTRCHENTPLIVDYEPSVREFVIRDRQNGRVIIPQKDRQGEFLAVYGLITVLNTRESERGRLGMVMFSGITSAGTHGAAEFFCSPRSLEQLRARFQKEGVRGFPQAYQVVVRCTFSNMLLLSYECIEHRILQK